MRPEELQVFWLLMDPWIAGLLLEHAQVAKPADSLGFPRLSSFFSPELLSSTRVVVANHVPLPPLKKMGLPKYAPFEGLNPPSISYIDTYFIKSEFQARESYHFHELVHVLQWKLLGTERYFTTYLQGLEDQGYRARDYRKSPLEVIACTLQARFEQASDVFDAEKEVRAELAKLFPDFL